MSYRATILGSWTTLVVTFPDADTRPRFRRIDLRVDRAWQPANALHPTIPPQDRADLVAFLRTL